MHLTIASTAGVAVAVSCVQCQLDWLAHCTLLVTAQQVAPACTHAHTARALCEWHKEQCGLQEEQLPFSFDTLQSGVWSQM